MAKYQFTMYSEKFRPVSTIVEADTRQDFVNKGKPYIKAIQNICVKRGWTMKDLINFGYGKWQVRKVEGQ